MIRTFMSEAPARQRVAAVGVTVLWMLFCAQWLAHTVAYPTKFGILVTAACLALPIAVLNLSRIPIFVLCVYAMLVPFNSLLNLTAQQAQTGTPGETLTKLLGIAAGACLLFATVARRRAVAPSKAMLVLAVLSAYLGLTVCWAIDSSVALDMYRIYLSYVGLYFAIALYPANRTEARLVIAAVLAGAVLSALYGAYAFWHGQLTYGARLGIRLGVEQIDPNEYATTLLTPIAIALMAFLRTHRVQKALWLLMLLVLLYGFSTSGSRGGMIALVVMILYLSMRTRYRMQVLAMLPLVAIAVAASPIGHRLMQSDLANADLRTDIWRVGFASLRQYWLTGAGIGNFGNAYAQFFLAVPHQALSWHRVAHSVLLQSAVEYGLPGLLLVLGVWYTQFTVLRGVARNDDMHDVALALQAGVLGLFVSGLSLSLFMYKYTWLTFGLVAIVRSAVLSSPRAHADAADTADTA